MVAYWRFGLRDIAPLLLGEGRGLVSLSMIQRGQNLVTGWDGRWILYIVRLGHDGSGKLPWATLMTGACPSGVGSEYTGMGQMIL